MTESEKKNIGPEGGVGGEDGAGGCVTRRRRVTQGRGVVAGAWKPPSAKSRAWEGEKGYSGGSRGPVVGGRRTTR